MTLAAYLAKCHMTIEAFAAKARLHPATIYRLKNGEQPHGGTLAKILAATDGEVTPNDLIVAPVPKKARKRAA